MKNIFSDTHPKIEKIWIEMIRTKSHQQKYQQTCTLSHNAISLSKRAIQRANPGATKRELDLLFVEYHYGKNLSSQLKTFLEKNDQ
jgi:hypothetical protein